METLFWILIILMIPVTYMGFFTTSNGPGPGKIGLRYCPWIPGGFYMEPIKHSEFVWFILPFSRIETISMTVSSVKDATMTAEPKLSKNQDGEIEGGFMVVGKASYTFRTGYKIKTKQDFIDLYMLVGDSDQNASEIAFAKLRKFFDDKVKGKENPAANKHEAMEIENACAKKFREIALEYFSEGELVLKIDVEDDVRQIMENTKIIKLKNQQTRERTKQLVKSSRELIDAQVTRKDLAAITVLASEEKPGVKINESTNRIKFEGENSNNLDPNIKALVASLIAGGNNK